MTNSFREAEKERLKSFKDNFLWNDQHGYNIIVTEAYVQGGTEIQVVYPTDLYLSTISLQFEQSVYKYLH